MEDDIEEAWQDALHGGVMHQRADCGVVSQPVVEAMVRGACRMFGSDFALASTGYAEAWEGHDVEIWIGWDSEDDVHSLCLTADRGRIGNVEEAARRVLEEFEGYICGI